MNQLLSGMILKWGHNLFWLTYFEERRKNHFFIGPQLFNASRLPHWLLSDGFDPHRNREFVAAFIFSGITSAYYSIAPPKHHFKHRNLISNWNSCNHTLSTLKWGFSRRISATGPWHLRKFLEVDGFPGSGLQYLPCSLHRHGRLCFPGRLRNSDLVRGSTGAAGPKHPLTGGGSVEGWLWVDFEDFSAKFPGFHWPSRRMPNCTCIYCICHILLYYTNSSSFLGLYCQFHNFRCRHGGLAHLSHVYQLRRGSRGFRSPGAISFFLV